jgi:hypothetical protein
LEKTLVLIEIVTHCYSSRFAQYVKLLGFQLSSLELHKPVDCDVRATVVTVQGDKPVLEMTGWFKENTSVDVNVLELDVDGMSKRSIGRNKAAFNSEADVIWFADADYVFRGCLNHLARITWLKETSIMHPSVVCISNDRIEGDKHTDQMEKPQLLDIDINTFHGLPQTKPIGGTSIIRGDFGRKYGYLGSKGLEKWQTPDPAGLFCNTPCDVRFRQFCLDKGRVQRVRLPGTYRLRHSEQGIERSAYMRKKRFGDDPNGYPNMG